MNDTPPVITRIPPPLWCAICYARNVPMVRLATHSVDGNSVCTRHLLAAIEHARQRRGQ